MSEEKIEDQEKQVDEKFYASGMKPGETLTAHIAEPPEQKHAVPKTPDKKYFLVSGEIIKHLGEREEIEMKKTTSSQNYREITKEEADKLLKTGKAKPCKSCV